MPIRLVQADVGRVEVSACLGWGASDGGSPELKAILRPKVRKDIVSGTRRANLSKPKPFDPSPYLAFLCRIAKWNKSALVVFLRLHYISCFSVAIKLGVCFVFPVSGARVNTD